MSRRLLRAVAAGALALSGSAGVVAVTATEAAAACEQPATSFKRQLRQAQSVFVGTISSRERSGDTVTYVVDVTSVYAGGIASSPVELTTSARRAECGLPRLEPGDEWLYLTGRGRDLRADSGSGPATDERLTRAEAVLGTPRAIAEPEPEPEPLQFTPAEASEPLPLSRLVAPGAAALLVGFLGWVAVRRVGRR